MEEGSGMARQMASRVSRRQMLRGTALVLGSLSGAAILAACGSSAPAAPSSAPAKPTDAPKPTTALLLNEVQVTGIFHTPRGWSAMVEASPLTPKLSYVIYPGENFFDGQLVAIEEGRLIFRRDIVWTDGRREKSVEIKPLRSPSPVETMTAAKTSPAEVPTTEVAKPAPEKQ